MARTICPAYKHEYDDEIYSACPYCPVPGLLGAGQKSISSQAELQELIRAIPQGIIGIDGYHGAGKSFLARSISDALSMPCVHVDAFVNPNQGTYVKSLRAIELSAALQPRPVIVEGVCLLADLALVGLKPDLLIYVAGDEPDPSTPLGMGALAEEVRRYHLKWRPRDSADILFQGTSARDAVNMSPPNKGMSATQAAVSGNKGMSATQAAVSGTQHFSGEISSQFRIKVYELQKLHARELYELQKQHVRERMRMGLTCGLVGVYLLSNIILVGLVVSGLTVMSNAKEISITFLTPILGLAGSSLGFYFGVSVYEDVKSSRSTKESP